MRPPYRFRFVLVKRCDMHFANPPSGLYAEGMSGDELTVFIALASMAGGGVMAAIAADGWRARVLWGVVLVFTLGAMAFWFRPPSVTAEQVWRYIIALTPFIVIFLVLLAREPKAPVLAKRERKPEPLTLHAEHPSMSAQHALGTILTSEWSKVNNATPERCAQELRDKLAAHKLTAWGRKDPDAVADPIQYRLWRGLKIEVGTGNAVTANGNAVAFSDLQFDPDLVKALWPQSSGPGSWMAR